MAARKDVRDFMSKLNLPSGAVSVFNEPDLLDDLLDHWTSSDHVQERQMLVRRLQVSYTAHACISKLAPCMFLAVSAVAPDSPHLCHMHDPVCRAHAVRAVCAVRCEHLCVMHICCSTE